MNTLKDYRQVNTNNTRLNDRNEVISTAGDKETYDWEESYESHYTPYEGLFSDSDYDFE